MKLSEWWLRVTKPFADAMIDHARHDPDISYREFRELLTQYHTIYNGRSNNEK